MRCRVPWIVMVSWLAIGPSWAVAQQPTSQGMFGSRTMGTAATTPTSNFRGTPAPTGGAFGAGTYGTGSMGTGSVVGATTQANATTGQITGNERFLRNRRQPGQFVGGDANTAQNFIGAMSMLSNSRGQGPRQAANDQDPNQSNSGTTQKKPYRTTLRVDFDYNPPAVETLSSTLERRLERAPKIRTMSPIDVQVEGRTAILRGEVATEHDRVLAAKLAGLEPGISRVRNDLKVNPSLGLPLKEGPLLKGPDTAVPGTSVPDKAPSSQLP